MLDFFETSTGNAVLSNGLGGWDAAIDGARRGSEDDDQGYAGRSLAELVEAATRAGGRTWPPPRWTGWRSAPAARARTALFVRWREFTLNTVTDEQITSALRAASSRNAA